MIKYLIAALLVSCVSCQSEQDKKPVEKEAKVIAPKPARNSPYALVDSIGKDKHYHVRFVEFQNGTLKISMDKATKESAVYFMTAYKLDSFDNIKRCEVYKYTNSIANPDKRKPVSVVAKQ